MSNARIEDGGEETQQQMIPELTTDDYIEAIGWGTVQWRLIFIISLLLVADGLELVLMTIIGPVLHYHWNLTTEQITLLSSCVFIGMSVGTLIIGKLSDVYGRRKVIISTTFFSTFYGLISSGATTFTFFIITRSILGIFISNHFQSINLMLEYSPRKQRSKANICTASMWSIGMFLGIFMGLFVLPTAGWRWFLIIATVPQIITLLSFYVLPESIRYLFVKQGSENAMKQIHALARANNKEVPRGVLVPPPQLEVGKYMDLFSKGYLRTTACLLTSIFGCYIVYYGIVFLQPIMMYSMDNVSVLHCRANIQDTSHFWSLLLPSFSEVICGLCAPFLWDRYGRKNTTFSYLIINAAVTSLLFHNNFSVLSLTAIFCVIRTLMFFAVSVFVLYCGEVYPTRMRGVAFGTVTCANKLGSIFAPIFGQEMYMTSPNLAIGCFMGISTLSGILFKLAPKETVNAPMADDE